jgi:PhnB protein
MALPPPKGFEGIVPYICVAPAVDAIAFYEKAFGAIEDFRIAMGDGIGHAELTIYGAKLMLSDPHHDYGAYSAKEIGGTPVTLHLYVDDADAALAKAVAAGATLERPAEDMFYGDRSGMIVCPFGHRWSFATHVEDVAPDELQRRVKEMFGQ